MNQQKLKEKMFYLCERERERELERERERETAHGMHSLHCVCGDVHAFGER